MIEQLVRQLYAALAAGDGERIGELLSPDFQGSLADGMPLGIGGRKSGIYAMRDNGWWAIGRAFSVRAQPDQWIPCADGRLLVTGRYVGRARSTGLAFEADFAHLWSAADGRLASLHQFTDTAQWHAALGEPA